MRRPQRERSRSDLNATMGPTKSDSSPGIDEKITPVIRFEAPNFLNMICITGGTARSRMFSAKSPPSSQKKSRSSPPMV